MGATAFVLRIGTAGYMTGRKGMHRTISVVMICTPVLPLAETGGLPIL